MTEDYEFYDAQGIEDVVPVEAMRPPMSLEEWELRLHEKNYSRDKLEKLLARAMYVYARRNMIDRLTAIE